MNHTIRMVLVMVLGIMLSTTAMAGGIKFKKVVIEVDELFTYYVDHDITSKHVIDSVHVISDNWYDNTFSLSDPGGSKNWSQISDHHCIARWYATFGTVDKYYIVVYYNGKIRKKRVRVGHKEPKYDIAYEEED